MINNHYLQSGGAAFSSNNFLEAKPNQKKQFIQVAARKILNGLVNTEIEEDCVCKQSCGVFAKPHCKIVNKREKEPLTVCKILRNEKIIIDVFIARFINKNILIKNKILLPFILLQRHTKGGVKG